MGEIYMIKNIVTGDSYIGQTTKSGIKRYRQHLKSSRNKNKKLPLYEDFRKYGKDNMVLIILEDNVPEEDLCRLEKYYIEKYNTFQSGYNNTYGGKGVSGYVHTDSDKEKMSVGIKNSMWKINTPERTAKIIAAQKGRKFTEEHKQHIRESIGDRHGTNNAFYGKHHTQKTKDTISLANTKYSVVQEKDGCTIQTFSNVKEAAEWCIKNNLTNGKLSSVMYRIYYTCIGKQKVSYGFNWNYVEKCID